MDPYVHQIQLLSALFEAVFFYNLLGTMPRVTEYWHRCNVEYIDQVMMLRYPDLYDFSAYQRIELRKAAKKETPKVPSTWSWRWIVPVNLVVWGIAVTYAYYSLIKFGLSLDK